MAGPGGDGDGRRRLYLLGGPIEAGDPLDPLAPLMAALAGRRRIADARPGGTISLRAAARAFRAGVDEALYDLTEPAALTMLRSGARIAPGAVLLSAHQPADTAGAGLASWPVPADLSRLAGRLETVVGVDAGPPLAGLRMRRPGCAAPAGAPEVELAIFGDAPALYAAALALARADTRPASVALVSPTAEDRAATANYADWLGLGPAAQAMLATGRGARARLAMTAGLVIDIAPAGWPGDTDPVAAARLGGRAAIRLDRRLDSLPERVARALATPPKAKARPGSTIDACVETILAATAAAARALAARRTAGEGGAAA